MKTIEERVKEFVDELQENVHQFVDYGMGYEHTPWIAITDDDGKLYLQKKILALIKSITDDEE
jgi:hypothetical protein